LEEKVIFFSGLGYRLTGTLYIPKGHRDCGRRPAIVLCQGYAGTKEMFLPSVAERLMEAGFVILNFDYRGFGESEGPRYRLMPLEQVEDIRNAITYLETRPEVDERCLGLWGTSFGGANCIYAAALDTRVRCVISNLGIGNGERWLHYLRREWEWREFIMRLVTDRRKRVTAGQSETVHPYDIMPGSPESWKFWNEMVKIYPERGRMMLPLESAEKIIEFKPEEVVHKIAPRSVLFISAEEDVMTPTIEQISMYQKAGEPKKLVIISGVDHHDIYNSAHFDQLMNLSTDWFNQHLCVK